MAGKLLDARLAIGREIAQRGGFTAMGQHEVGIKADKRIAGDALPALDALQQKAVRPARCFTIGRDWRLDIRQQIAAQWQQWAARLDCAFRALLQRGGDLSYLVKCRMVHSVFLRDLYADWTSARAYMLKFLHK